MLIFLFIFLTIIFSILTSIPLGVIMLACLTVIFKKTSIFFIALFLGLLLDLFFLRPFGTTGLIFVIFVFLIMLYERKFETQTVSFIFFATFLGSLIYLLIFGYNNVLIQSIINAIIGVLFFKLLWLRLGRRSEII